MLLQCETCGKYTERLIDHYGTYRCLDCYIEAVTEEAQETFYEESFDSFDDEEE